MLPPALSQVFLNLLVNAAQAIEKQGRDPRSTTAIDTGVRCRIADTGSGIRPEDIQKVFDPFFTTKAVGKGTGMGLNISWKTIEEHGGTIQVDSTAGEGTVFTIRLPMVMEEPKKTTAGDQEDTGVWPVGGYGIMYYIDGNPEGTQVF
jgi:two-component system NtrC family sensor kinase